MKFVRFGGTNVVKQNNLKGNRAAQTVGAKRRNRRAPAKRGVWAFPDGLIDTVYLSATGPNKEFNRDKRVFEYKGPVFMHMGDIPERFRGHLLKIVETDAGLWGLVSYDDFKKIANIKKRKHRKTKRVLYAPQTGIKLELLQDSLKYIEYFKKWRGSKKYKATCECCGKTWEVEIFEPGKENQIICRECDIPANEGFEVFIPATRV